MKRTCRRSPEARAHAEGAGAAQVATATADIAVASGPAGASDPVEAGPGQVAVILYTTGTTGDPKAIPWNHASPLKGAADACYHLDVHPGDVLAVNDLGSPSYATPAIGDSRIYIRTVDTLWAFGHL